jgi:hypothetical protein
MRREFGAFSFVEPPQPWNEDSLVYIGPPIKNGATPTLVFGHMQRAPGEPLEAAVWRVMLARSKRDRDVAVFEPCRIHVASREAMRVGFKLVTEGTVTYETMVFVDSPDGDILSVACSIVYGVDDPPVLESEWLPVLERVVASMLPKGSQAPEPSRPKVSSSSPPPPEPEVPSLGPLVPMPGDYRRSRGKHV